MNARPELTPQEIQAILDDMSLDPDLRAKLELLLEATLQAITEEPGCQHQAQP